MTRQELQDAIDQQHAMWQRLARSGSSALRNQAFKKLQAMELQLDEIDQLQAKAED